jgi:hypothetical protein
MATELLSPLLLLLLLAVVTFSCSPVAARTPELVELTLLAGAREKGAGIRPPPFLFNRLVKLVADRPVSYRCSVLGWEPARLPPAERLRLRCPQLARLPSGELFFFSPSEICCVFMNLACTAKTTDRNLPARIRDKNGST